MVLVLAGCATPEAACPEVAAPPPPLPAIPTAKPPDPADPLAGLAWLAGGWFSEEGGVRQEEHWTLPRAGAMLGVNRTIRDGQMVHHEFVLLERTAEGVVYRALPSTQPAVSFPLVTLEGTHAVFADEGHDFPQRIDYRLEGDTLRVLLDGVEKGQPRTAEWRWRRER